MCVFVKKKKELHLTHLKNVRLVQLLILIVTIYDFDVTFPLSNARRGKF